MEMMSGIKYDIFNHICNILNNRCGELNKLKSIELLFILCHYSRKMDGYGLYKYFNNFRAMPHGIIEIDIYEYCLNGEYVKRYHPIDDSISQLIDESINLVGDRILNMNSMELIEMVRMFSLWKFYYNLGISEGTLSKEIHMSSLILE